MKNWEPQASCAISQNTWSDLTYLNLTSLPSVLQPGKLYWPCMNDLNVQTHCGCEGREVWITGITKHDAFPICWCYKSPGCGF